MTSQFTSLGYAAAHAQTDVNNKGVDVIVQNVTKILEILSRNAQNSSDIKGSYVLNNEEYLNHGPMGIASDNVVIQCF